MENQENQNKSDIPTPKFQEIPAPITYAQMNKQIQDSFQEFKKKHNIIADGMKELEAKMEELQAENNEIKEFLTFTNKRYRKFYHKRHLKNRFK